MAETGYTLPSAQAQWEAGHILRAARFDDVYFSRDGGLAEKRHVFLGGCGLPNAWAGTQAFTIGELGFGTGLNFLMTWDAWRRSRAPDAQLHYLAVEGFPLTRAELADALSAWTELQPLATALLRAYPEPRSGFHRLVLKTGDDEVFLTLLYGEAAAMLSQAEANVDAWFLDGFAPDRNPEMWRTDVIAEVARLSHGTRTAESSDAHGLTRAPTRFATYTVAGAVRHELVQAGFEIARAPGFGTKREMLHGFYRGTDAATTQGVAQHLSPWFARAAVPVSRGHAAIIGAGIAGCSMAAALMRRGWRVTLIDRNDDVALAASGNPVGILMPRVTASASIEGRFAMAAWRFVVRTLEDLNDTGVPLGWERCGVLQLPEDDNDAARLNGLTASGMFSEREAFYLNAAEASAWAGYPVPAGLFFKDGGLIQPRLLCQALARGAQHMMGTGVVSLEHAGDGFVLTSTAATSLKADVVILANGLDAATLPDTNWLPVSARRGQLTFAAPTAASGKLRCVVSYGGYVTPVMHGRHGIGATFDWIETPASPQPVIATDHARNRAELENHLPGFLGSGDLSSDTGRAAVRCVTTDHLPIAGPAPDRKAYLADYAHLRHGQHWRHYPPATYHGGLYVLTGLGSRGLVEAPLAAEVLASHISGEPWPLERDLVTALVPARFLVRDLKRLRA